MKLTRSDIKIEFWQNFELNSIWSLNFFFRFHDSRKWKINQLYIFWKFNTINWRFVFFVFDMQSQMRQQKTWLCWPTEHTQLQCNDQNAFQTRAKNKSISKKQTVRKFAWQNFWLFYFTQSKKCLFLRALCFDRKKKWT